MSVLVAQQAPDFTAPAVMSDGTIKEDFKLSSLKGKPFVLFFWPFDFTFVCPTEIIAHDHRLSQFHDRGVQVVGVSNDSFHTHHAWRETPVDKGGIGKVQFPIVADIKHQVSRAYAIEHPEAGVAMRASFLVDKHFVVQHQVVNNLPLGRNVDEMLRMIDAMLFHEKHGEVCPAGWKNGQDAMKETPDSVASYLSKHAREL
jgi:peroxiredoxin (alkyl hydroperoxide reductase subunit C)